MSVLSGTSSLTEVQREYDDCASYAEDVDLGKARRFVTACRILLRRSATDMIKGSNQARFRVDLLQVELLTAQRWLEARDPDANAGPAATRPDLRRFRGT